MGLWENGRGSRERASIFVYMGQGGRKCNVVTFASFLRRRSRVPLPPTFIANSLATAQCRKTKII